MQEQFHQDFAGDEYRFDGYGDWANAPALLWNDGKLHFVAGWADNASASYGSVWLFLPQS
jgi:hypothetical protein